MSKILDFSHGDPQTTSTSPRGDPAVFHQDSFFGPGEVGTQEAMDGYKSPNTTKSLQSQTWMKGTFTQPQLFMIRLTISCKVSLKTMEFGWQCPPTLEVGCVIPSD